MQARSVGKYILVSEMKETFPREIRKFRHRNIFLHFKIDSDCKRRALLSLSYENSYRPVISGSVLTPIYLIAVI